MDSRIGEGSSASVNALVERRRKLLKVLLLLTQLLRVLIDDTVSQYIKVSNWLRSISVAFSEFASTLKRKEYIKVSNWLRSISVAFSEFASTLKRKETIRMLWQYDRGPGLDLILLNTYSAHEFKRRLRVSKQTFYYLCQELGPAMKKEDTRFRPGTPVDKRIMIALTRLATGDTLIGIADSYRVGYATVQMAVMDFVHSVNARLKNLYICWPSFERMKKLAAEFESVHGIPFVIGAIDGSHIPIIAPKSYPQEYYNRKGFHSILLQLIVSKHCLIWDFDLGWPGSIHDWTMFQRSAGGKKIIHEDIKPYCLVGDAAYPPRSYMLSPFKGHKDGLSREEYYWNYVQSSTRMLVEQAFGRLKARFRILLKRNDMDLENTAAAVSACLVLHNLCIIHADGFDESWSQEATRELELSIDHEKHLQIRKKARNNDGSISNLSASSEILNYCQYGLYKLHGTCLTVEEAMSRTLDGQNEQLHIAEDINVATGNAARRNAIARSLFQNRTQELVRQQTNANDATKRVAEQFGVETSSSDSI